MKHAPEQPSVREFLLSFASDHGIHGLEDHILLLSDLLAWLAPAAHQVGLTKYGNPHSLVEHLVLPALTMLRPSVSDLLAPPALDFGAGSGAVGLSLAVARPDLQVILADRRRRVVQFVDLAIQRFGLRNCRTLLVDLTDPPPDLRGNVATVLIRAFGPAEQALADAREWLRPDGLCALWCQPESLFSPVGYTALRTEPTGHPSLVLNLYRRT